MNIDDTTALVSGMAEDAANEILALVADRDVRVNLAPRSGLVMMTVTDSFLTDFHLGEVLVCEARVTVDNIEGYGMVAGDNPRVALARAVASAVLKDAASPVRQQVAALLDREDTERKKRQAADRGLMASTKVEFNLMAGA